MDAKTEQTELETLELTKNHLVQQIKNIDVDLGTANKLNRDTGERLEGHTYWAWRDSAIRAKRGKELELIRVKAKIKNLAAKETENFDSRLTRIEEKIDLILLKVT